MSDAIDNIVKLATFMEQEALPELTEIAMAAEFAARHEHELRYVPAWGRWLHFDATRWQHDSTLQAFDRVRALCREVAARSEKPKSQHIIASARTVAAVERLARSDRALVARTEQWDAESFLLNTPGSTVDLRVGTGCPPDPSDYITRVTACVCAPTGTPCPQWTKFLYRVCNNDVELIEFLQRFCGYALTGQTSEHAFVFAYGTGANGKSTFVSTIAGILGDFAQTADMATFLAANNERHPTDLAGLNGARLVTAMETARGKRWDETKVKNLTGGDKVSARFMRQDFFSFTPTFKLLISGNSQAPAQRRRRGDAAAVTACAIPGGNPAG